LRVENRDLMTVNSPVVARSLLDLDQRKDGGRRKAVRGEVDDTAEYWRVCAGVPTHSCACVWACV
jgi:hypothetical protein